MVFPIPKSRSPFSWYLTKSAEVDVYKRQASAYQKPLSCYEITESTPLYNPYWDYAQKMCIRDSL